MFIHLNSDGTIAKVLHDRVIRRSNVNKIYVFAPFAPGSTVLIHFQKPNGELITGPMIFKEFNLANQINTWEYSLMNRTITDIAGKVLISLEIRAITEGGVEITATPNTHMWVEESIGELPEIEEVDEFLNLANLAMERVIALEEEFEETQLTEEDKVKLNNLPLNTIAELESKVDLEKTTITIDPEDWIDFQATKTVSGVTSTSLVWVSPAETSYDDYVEAEIRAIAQSANSITFQCENVPDVSININIVKEVVPS